MNNIGVVVVTYNRLDKLKTALQSYEIQSFKPDYILVVDNNSTDGTKEYLEKWKQLPSSIEHKILTLKENSGGSGGFHAGIVQAERMGTEWIWVADDDAYPDKLCFQRLSKYIQEHNTENISALCSSVYTNGKIDTWHRRRFRKRMGFILDEQCIDASEYRADSFCLDLFSYVGTLLKTESLKKAGLPEKDFFIAYDDSEHSIRMRKQGKIVCVPKAVVEHDTPDINDSKITWKKYYALRNKFYSYRKHFGRFQSLIQQWYFLIKNRTNKDLYHMTLKAMADAKKEHLGLDATYIPGWGADCF